MISTKFYAYRDKRTGEWATAEYRGKAPATSALYEHIGRPLRKIVDGRWVYPTQGVVKALAGQHYVLVKLELHEVSDG